MQTVSPVASRLGLKVVKRYAAGDEGHLTKEVIALPGATLIAWRHEALHKHPPPSGRGGPDPTRLLADGPFRRDLDLHPDGDRWRFAQMPQFLLPGDLPYPWCLLDHGHDLSTGTV